MGGKKKRRWWMSHRFSSQATPLGNGIGVFGGEGVEKEGWRGVSNHLRPPFTVYNPQWEQLIRRLADYVLFMSVFLPLCVSLCADVAKS